MQNPVRRSRSSQSPTTRSGVIPNPTREPEEHHDLPQPVIGSIQPLETLDGADSLPRVDESEDLSALGDQDSIEGE